MNPHRRRQQGKAPLDLIEEATHQLRTAPAAAFAIYFLGTIPCVLGLLFFWADMSRNPLAPQHLAAGSLGAALLFFWMKYWQAIFALRMRAHAAGRPPASRPISFHARLFAHQVILQPAGLFLLPLAAALIFPFPWVQAFFQNVTALEHQAETGTGALLKSARRQTALWPMQNGIVVAIIFLGLVPCVFLNWATVCLTLPALCKMLLGIQSDFTRSPFALLNSTFFAAVAALTYLCADPLLKTIYVLRCFYGESLASGDDLKAELAPFRQASLKIAVAALFLATVCFAAPSRAEPTNAAALTPSPSVSAAELDRTIAATIHEPKYVWRMPRERVIEPEVQEGVIAKFFDKVGALIRKCVQAVFNWLKWLLQKLFPHRWQSPIQAEPPGYGWIMLLQVLLYGLVAAAIVALALLIHRVWRARHLPAPVAAGEAIQPAPDLADENVRADQLPEDGWIKLARELLDRGEFRLAMRAFYLSALAHLAARNLINIARFKSNRDYERELRRRAHAFPDLLSAFDDNLPVFERIWYGMHDANRELVTGFAANLEKLKRE